MTNVVHLFAGEKSVGGTKVSPKQLDLFQDGLRASGVVAYVDTELSSQEALFRTLAATSARCVIDIRKSAAFPKPRFWHKEVMDYFARYRIQHVDLYEDVNELSSTSAAIFSQANKGSSAWRLADLLESGPCVVVYSSAEELDRIKQFKKVVSAYVPQTVVPARREEA